VGVGGEGVQVCTGVARRCVSERGGCVHGACIYSGVTEVCGWRGGCVGHVYSGVAEGIPRKIYCNNCYTETLYSIYVKTDT